MYLPVLVARTTTNSPPSGAAAGVSLRVGSSTLLPGLGLDDKIDSAVCYVKSTAGSGTMTCTVKLWAYSAVAAAWFPLGTGADTTKGTINAGAAIGETTADNIAHAELVSGLAGMDRIYAEITAIGGTATAISVWLQARG